MAPTAAHPLNGLPGRFLGRPRGARKEGTGGCTALAVLAEGAPGAASSCSRFSLLASDRRGRPSPRVSIPLPAPHYRRRRSGRLGGAQGPGGERGKAGGGRVAETEGPRAGRGGTVERGGALPGGRGRRGRGRAQGRGRGVGRGTSQPGRAALPAGTEVRRRARSSLGARVGASAAAGARDRGGALSPG